MSAATGNVDVQLAALERIAAALDLHQPCHPLAGERAAGDCSLYFGGLHIGTPFCTTCTNGDDLGSSMRNLARYPCPTALALGVEPA